MPKGKSVRRNASHWGTFTAEVEDGQLTAVKPFPGDPDPSPILDAVLDYADSAARVATPVVRKGWLDNGPGGTREKRGAEPFVAVSWDKALDLVAGEVKRVVEKHGNTAIYGGSYGWGSAGCFHVANAQLYRFLNCYGGFTEKSESYSYAAGTVITKRILGSFDSVVGHSTSWASMAESTRLMVMFGGAPLKNTQVEFGGVGHHTTPAWLRKIREAGARFVVISPIRDDYPDFLDAEWITPRPNTDTAILLGIAHTLLTEGLYDRAFLDRYCVGFDRFARYLTGADDRRPKDAVWAGAIAALDPEIIRNLARRMAATRTMLTLTWSLQRTDHGEQPYWAAIAVAAMLGQIGLPGGGFGFGYGSESSLGMPRRRLSAPRVPALENPTRKSIPVARISDMLLNPGGAYQYDGEDRTYPDIRMIYWCGGNPFHHHQDLNRLVRAWQRPETIVVHEPYWTATARYADIVLPATTTIERMDMAASSRDRFLVVMEPVIPPVGQARDDHQIFADLAGRLGFRQRFTEGRTPEEWLRHLYDRFRQQASAVKVELPDFDTFWAQGHVEIPEPETPFVMLEDFRRDPEAHKLKTPSGKIEIFSEAIASFGYDDCPPHPAWMEPLEWLGAPKAKRYPLHLMSNQPRTRLHGQMDHSRVSRGGKRREREPILIHPEDAASRGIRDGDIVRVFNDRGAMLACATLSDEIRREVVQIATGATYDPAEPGVPGSLEKHGNPNVLTLDKGTSKLAQGPTAHSTLVEIERYDGVPPPVTAFVPPKIISPA